MKYFTYDHNGCFVTNEQTKTIIKAANIICDEFNNKVPKKG
jgi:endonuclease III